MAAGIVRSHRAMGRNQQAVTNLSAAFINGEWKPEKQPSRTAKNGGSVAGRIFFDKKSAPSENSCTATCSREPEPPKNANLAAPFNNSLYEGLLEPSPSIEVESSPSAAVGCGLTPPPAAVGQENQAANTETEIDCPKAIGNHSDVDLSIPSVDMAKPFERTLPMTGDRVVYQGNIYSVLYFNWDTNPDDDVVGLVPIDKNNGELQPTRVRPVDCTIIR